MEVSGSHPRFFQGRGSCNNGRRIVNFNRTKNQTNRGLNKKRFPVGSSVGRNHFGPILSKLKMSACLGSPPGKAHLQADGALGLQLALLSPAPLLATPWPRALPHHLALAPASQCYHSLHILISPQAHSRALSFPLRVLNYIPGTNYCFASFYKVG